MARAARHARARIIFVCNRRTKDRHYGIAQVAVNTTLFRLNSLSKAGKTPIHQIMDFFRIQSLADRCEARHVGENDSNFPAVLAQGVNKLVAAVTAEREVLSGYGGAVQTGFGGATFHGGIPALNMAENNSPRNIESSVRTREGVSGRTCNIGIRGHLFSL